MNLTTWMAKKGLNDEAVALAVGVTRPYISRVRNGLVHPSLGTALKLWDFTERKVDLRQLLPIHMRPAETTKAVKQPVAAAPKPDKPRKQPVRKSSRSLAAA